jgi:hypothetical protein
MAKKMAKKKPAKKPAVKKAAKKPAPKPKPKVRAAAAKSNGKLTPWFDAAKHKPLITEYAQRLQPFLDALADGEVTESEIKAQEDRLVAAMKAVEPQLKGPLHGQVTRLLCEMAAYDLMQALHAVQASRPQTVFRG